MKFSINWSKLISLKFRMSLKWWEDSTRNLNKSMKNSNLMMRKLIRWKRISHIYSILFYCPRHINRLYMKPPEEENLEIFLMKKYSIWCPSLRQRRKKGRSSYNNLVVYFHKIFLANLKTWLHQFKWSMLS